MFIFPFNGPQLQRWNGVKRTIHRVVAPVGVCQLSCKKNLRQRNGKGSRENSVTFDCFCQALPLALGSSCTIVLVESTEERVPSHAADTVKVQQKKANERKDRKADFSGLHQGCSRE